MAFMLEQASPWMVHSVCNHDAVRVLSSAGNKAAYGRVKYRRN